MKPFYYIVLVVATVLLAACHTTETNYKESYDKAVNKSRTGANASEYEARQMERVRFTSEVDGDSVRLIREYFNIVDDSVSVLKRYGVVVGEFKQKFNAMSMRDRLRQDGQPSYVVYTGASDKTYLVVAHAYDDITLAAAYIRIMKKETSVKPTVPLPWILERIR